VQVPERPHVLLSVATSADGYIDDASGTRLVLSNAADLDRVDEVRAGSDAILVGARTIRRDNPALLVRSAQRRARRVAQGLPPSPVRVTLTASGDLDPASRFFAAGEAGQLVYVPGAAADLVRGRLASAASAEVIAAGDPLDLAVVLADLRARGVRRLMVEGGGTVHAQFLAARLADELHLVVAPLAVADPAAPRFAGGAGDPAGGTGEPAGGLGNRAGGPGNRAGDTADPVGVSGGPAGGTGDPAGRLLGSPPAVLRLELAEVRQIGDRVLLRYLLPRHGDGRDGNFGAVPRC
jgi:5-amino-6-(5-phosphoribosylamino)uracil reductase